jgi:hypothetical protein
MSDKIDNKPKNKGGNPKWKKGMASPNPAGRPKDGESWAAIIKSIGDMYPDDLIAFIGTNNDLGRNLAQLPKNVQMKYLVTARVFAALMFEPTSGLWKELMERSEGKVSDKLDVTSNGETVGKDDDVTGEILRKLASISTAVGTNNVYNQPDTSGAGTSTT